MILNCQLENQDRLCCDHPCPHYCARVERWFLKSRLHTSPWGILVFVVCFRLTAEVLTPPLAKTFAPDQYFGGIKFV